MNILVIMSDEHSNEVMSCSGHLIVKTPNLDALAEAGTRFANCYTGSPLCVPARASFFTSQYVNKLGTWDNATPYDGKVLGMSQYLHRYGYDMTAFGKLDFHPEGFYEGLDHRLPEQREKTNVGSFFRESNRPRPNIERRFKNMGIRDAISYDETVRDAAVEWLSGKKSDDKPWILYVGFTNPHFPFWAKKEYWEYYDKTVTDIPNSAKEPFTSLNEPLMSLRRHFKGEAADEEIIRKAHVGYYAMVSEMDYNVGCVLKALKERGLEGDTLVIYTSDHGEQLGHHGLWWKCCMFEESVHVPLIIKGPKTKRSAESQTLVSLIDIFPTLCQALNIPIPANIAGCSLWDLACGRSDTICRDFVFSEYHAHGMPVGIYMVRWEQWKYVYYVGYNPQLFDLQNDKNESHDLYPSAASSSELQYILEQCHNRLIEICDPEEVDARAKAFQAKARHELKLKDYDESDTEDEQLDTMLHPEYMI